MICNFYLYKNIERYFISLIHPKLEIRRNIVASINELWARLKDITTINNKDIWQKTIDN
jgi:hypothetical protein